MRLVISVVVIIVALTVLTKIDKRADGEPEVVSAGGDSATTCRKSAECWGKNNLAAATIYCSKSIEAQAAYDVRWKSELHRLTRWGWDDETKGTLKYGGDGVLFQNGFGAWQPQIYLCRFDPENRTVIETTVAPGRLDP